MVQSLVERFARDRLVAIIRADSAPAALALARSAVTGGFRLVEVTLTTPGAEQIVSELAGIKGVLVGCGTVLTVEAAQRSIDWGAQFLVSPHADERLIALTREAGLLSIAGALTPTEILRAWQVGADVVKVFPIAQIGGVEYLRALRGPLPDVPLLPTGGIGAEDFLDYLEAGALAVGIGRSLAPAAEVRQGRWSDIASRASDWVLRLPGA